MTSDKKSRVENGTVRRGKPCAEHVEGLGDVMMKHNKKVVDYIGVVSNPIKRVAKRLNEYYLLQLKQHSTH